MKVEDRLEIAELSARYAEALDWKNWPLLEKVFTADCVFDLTSRGGPRLEGREAILSHMQKRQLSLAHIVSNVIIEPQGDGRAVMRSRVLGVKPGGVVIAAAFIDQVYRTTEGWRITNRQYKPTDVATAAGDAKSG